MRYCKDGLTIKDKLKEEDVCNGECIAQCNVKYNCNVVYTEIDK